MNKKQSSVCMSLMFRSSAILCVVFKKKIKTPTLKNTQKMYISYFLKTFVLMTYFYDEELSESGKFRDQTTGIFLKLLISNIMNAII